MICFNKLSRKLFLFLFLIYYSTNTFAQNADITILKNINLNRPVKFDPIFRTITNATYPISVTVPIALMGKGYFKKDSALKSRSIQIVSALGMAAVVTEGLKIIVRRPRPFITYPFIQKATEGNGYSFPSGHVSIAFATATSLCLINHKWYVILPSLAWASTIAYARMDLGVHYPTDVLAGAVIGTASAFISYKVNKWLCKKLVK